MRAAQRNVLKASCRAVPRRGLFSSLSPRAQQPQQEGAPAGNQRNQGMAVQQQQQQQQQPMAARADPYASLAFPSFRVSSDEGSLFCLQIA